MFERFRGTAVVLAGSLALLLAACGGSGGGDDNGSNGGGGGGGGGGSAKSCAEQFNPAAAETNPDACQPEYSTQCDTLGARPPLNVTEASPCTKGGQDGGVTAENVAAGDVTYTLLRPASGGKSGLYVGLHWRAGNGATMANNMRLAELAKARNLTIAVPDSPGSVFDFGIGGFMKDWDFEGAPDAVAAVIADAKTRAGLGNVPVIVSGVSSGAAGAARVFCAHGTQLSGLMLVSAGEISGASSTACLSASASASKAVTDSVPVVMIQGGRDPAYADAHANFERFLTINGCSGLKTVALNSDVDIEYSVTCSSGDGMAFVNVKDSGHNWPGMDRPVPSNPITDLIPAGSSSGAMSIFGRVSYSFDATVQGYDLVRWLD